MVLNHHPQVQMWGTEAFAAAESAFALSANGEALTARYGAAPHGPRHFPESGVRIQCAER